MALDMANKDASSAIVKVLVSFYLATTDESSSTARTSAIHKEKFNVPLSRDEPNDLSNIMKHLKTLKGLAEISKSKGLGENSEVMHMIVLISCSFIILRYKELHTYTVYGALGLSCFENAKDSA